MYAMMMYIVFGFFATAGATTGGRALGEEGGGSFIAIDVEVSAAMAVSSSFFFPV